MRYRVAWYSNNALHSLSATSISDAKRSMRLLHKMNTHKDNELLKEDIHIEYREKRNDKWKELK